MKKQLSISVLFFFVGCYAIAQSVIVNPDGTHSVIINNGNTSTVVNPNGTHSTLFNNGNTSILVNPNGTHSTVINKGSTSMIINPVGTHLAFINNDTLTVGESQEKKMGIRVKKARKSKNKTNR